MAEKNTRLLNIQQRTLKNSDLLVYPNIVDKPNLYMRIPIKNSIKALDFEINQKISNAVLDSSLCDAGKNSIEDINN